MSVQDELLQIIEKQSQLIQQCQVSLKQVNSAIASQQQTIQQQQRRITQLEQQLETSIDATATAIADATRSEQQFKRNIERVDQNTTTLRRYVKSSEEISAQQTIQQTDVSATQARKVENKQNDDDYNDFRL